MGTHLNPQSCVWYSGQLIVVPEGYWHKLSHSVKFYKSHILQKPQTVNNYQNIKPQFPAKVSGVCGENVQA